MKRIVFNGREYASVEEMPAEARRAYEEAMQLFADADKDGIPDIVQKGGVGIHTTKIEITGSGGELPEAVRGALRLSLGGGRPFGQGVVIAVLLAVIVLLVALLIQRE